MSARDFIRSHRWRLLALLALTLAAAWWFYHYGDGLTRESVLDYGIGLPAGWFTAAFFVLPLIGFPVSILLVLAGVRFGFWGGMALATGGILFHHVAACHVTRRWLREQVARRLEAWGRRIPRVNGRSWIWFTALFAAIHGPPYALKLYLLALTEVPFRVYLWVGAPVYIFFCVVPVGAGSAVTTFDPTWIYVIIIGGTSLALLGRWLGKRYGGNQ